MLKNLFKKNTKKVEVENVVQTNQSRYDGQIYKGVWRIGGKEMIGAYLRDGSNSFATDKGVYQIPKGVKKTQIAKVIELNENWYIKTSEGLVKLNVNASAIEHNIECLKNNWCCIYITEDEI